MATAKNILKSWFSNKKKPPQEQFWAWMESYWHKDEKIPISSIVGLNNLISGVAAAEGLEALRQQVIALQTLLKSNDTNLDELQEIVNFIKQNKTELDTLAISNIAGLQETLEGISQNIENRGLQDDEIITIVAETPYEYILPQANLLFAFELEGECKLKIGSISGDNDIAQLEGIRGDILQLGLLNVNRVWIQTDETVNITPIIYKRRATNIAETF